MKIVILVDREKFIHDFFKLILVEFEVKFYSFFELSNNLYMIKDLDPDLLFIDINSLSQNDAQAVDDIKVSDKLTKLVKIAIETDEISSKELFSGFFTERIKKPLSPTVLCDKINSLI